MLPIGEEPQPFIESSADNTWPAFSPDGRWVAYASNETGLNEVYILPFPGPGRRIQISTNGGGSNVWARNGRELFFTRLSDQRSDISPVDMMAVDITTGPIFTASRPQPLFRGHYSGPIRTTNWDIAPDGRKFLMIENKRQPLRRVTELRVILNWFDELQRLVPIDN
jgi:hypothetical protein